MFTSLVLSTTGGMARESTICFKRFDDAIAKTALLQSDGLAQVQILFALIRSAIMARDAGPDREDC